VWDCYGCGVGGDHNDVAERAYRKRRRVSENQEIEDRLESLILRVGEKVLLLLSLN
jgi:nuclear cap-binding protein subunit 1